jgi:beta-galactosidase
VLDSSRFISNAFARFNMLQANILRPRIGDRFITTNFMAFRPEVDPMGMSGELSLFSWDSYPVAGPAIKATSNDEYRIGDPSTIGFVHDQMASYAAGGRWALMELQPGQTNWGGYPVLPYPGAIRLWIWTALAHGAEFVTTYRYRQPLYGSELFHHGLVGTDGTTPSAGGRQFTQAIDELKRIDVEKWNAGADRIDPAKTIGLVLDFEQFWEFDALPQAVRCNQPKWLTTWYAAATRLRLRVRILHPKRDWPAELKLIVAAGMQMVDDRDVLQMKTYVEGGGHLVLTCRTALMDRTGHLWQDKTAAPILDLIGGEIAAYDALPEDCTGEVAMDRKKYSWSVWADLLYAEERSKVVAKYANHMYAGAAAVIQCRRGKTGMTTYCGVYADAPFIEALMEKLATQAELTQTPMPSSRVQLIGRGPYRVLLNYQDNELQAPAPRGARFLVGGEHVEPAGVAIWEVQ